MRPLARAFCATLAFLPALAVARDYVAESRISLSLVAHHTGVETVETASSGRETVRASHVRRVITNATILDALVSAEIINSRRDWRLVAVWANWPESGNGYRFYVQNLAFPNEVHRIPEDILSFETLGGVVARRHTLADDSITAGTETYKINTRLRFGDAAFSGELIGLVTGQARYDRPRDADAALYVPGATTFKGFGPLLPASESETPPAHASGTLTLGAAVPVPLARYQTGSSDGSSTGNTTIGSGTLTLGGTGSLSSGNNILVGALSPTPGATNIAMTDGTYLTLRSGSTLVVNDPNLLSRFDLLNLPPGATFLDGVLTIRPVSDEPIPPDAPAAASSASAAP